MNEYFRDNQQLLLNLANTEAGRFLLGIKDTDKIIKLSPNSIHQLRDIQEDKAIIQAKFYASNHIAKILMPIISQIEIVDNEYRKIDNLEEAFLHYSGLQTKYNKYPLILMTTFNLSGSGLANSEGFLLSPGSGFTTFASARAGTSIATNNSGDLGIGMENYSAGSFAIIRYFCKINYTSLPVGAVVQSGSFELNARYYQATATDAYNVCAGNQSNTLTGTDWGSGNFATLWGTGNTPSTTAQHYEACPLNATGLAAISATNIKYGILSAPDYANSAWSSLGGPIPNSAAGTNPPNTSIIYTLPTSALIVNVNTAVHRASRW